MVVARVSKAAARPVTDALGPLHEALAMAPAAGKVTAMRAYNDSTERRQNQGFAQLNQLVYAVVWTLLLCYQLVNQGSISVKANPKTLINLALSCLCAGAAAAGGGAAEHAGAAGRGGRQGRLRRAAGG